MACWQKLPQLYLVSFDFLNWLTRNLLPCVNRSTQFRNYQVTVGKHLTHESPYTPHMTPSRARFTLLRFAFALSVVTYLDRVCIATAAGSIRAELHLDAVQMGWEIGRASCRERV